MFMSKAPITRFANLVIDTSLDDGNPYNIMRCPRVTTQEINAIPEDGLQGGEILFNIDLNEFQLYDGTNWINPNGGGGAEISSYCTLHRLSSNSASYLGNNDHCPFNQTSFSHDPEGLMSLSTSAYTTNVGVHCLGRVKLKAGYIYKISGFATSTGNATFYGYSLYDVTSNNTRFGTYAGGHASPDPDQNSDTIMSVGYINATEDRIIELRKTGGTMIQWYAGNTNLSECWLDIRTVGKI